MNPPPTDLTLESLEVGAAPLARHFLDRLDLPALLERHLPALPGRQPAVPSSVVLTLLVQNFLLARQPLYAIPAWIARHVPAHLGLQQQQVALFNDDRLGRALDHLHRADRASLLTTLVLHAVRTFAIELDELHQDTTTITFSGDYTDQDPVQAASRPPRITFGHNKDHRPDLKQLLYGVTISADGAVPIHCKLWDGNTTDDQVHVETWDFLRQLAGTADFLYVADCKLCTRDNMHHIASRKGRFLTVMPRTRKEDRLFREQLVTHPVLWQEVHREANPRRRDGPDQVYQAVEGPQRSVEGYRVLWYRSSLKAEQDGSNRWRRLQKARERLAVVQAQREFQTTSQAHAAGQRIIEEEEVGEWLTIEIREEVEIGHSQIGPGRPGSNTLYERTEKCTFRIGFCENVPALQKAASSDGVFPLMTNDETLSPGEALLKYKYQPFVEKRHEQLKNAFAVAPVWLKSPSRVESLLWLYHVVELTAALVEREVRKRMEEAELPTLALYPEGRPCDAPTTNLVFGVLDGLRQHRLLTQAGEEVQRFHDRLPDAAEEVLQLLEINLSPYGLD